MILWHLIPRMINGHVLRLQLLVCFIIKHFLCFCCCCFAFGWHPLVKFCLNWSYWNIDIIYLWGYTMHFLCLEWLMLISFVTTTSTSGYRCSNTTMAFSWNKRVFFCFVFSCLFFYSICLYRKYAPVIVLMWRLRFLTEMLTKEFCFGLKLQFAEAVWTADSRLLYYLIREIKTWLNINAYGNVLLCET